MRSLLRNLTISDGGFNRLVIGAVSLGFIALIACGIAATQAILENQRHSQWVNHSYEVERQISQFRVMLERAEAARRAYLLTSDPAVAQTYLAASGRILPTLENVRRLTSDNPVQQVNVRRAENLAAQDVALMNMSYAMVGAGRRAEAIARFQKLQSTGLVHNLRVQTEAMLLEENRLLAIRDRAQAGSLRYFFLLLSATGILLVIVGGSSIWVIVHYTRDLTASRDQLRSLNEGLEGAVRERTTDLQRANDEIQRFAYIVSHDLRSPLVNVMGFTAELETAAKQLSAFIEKVDAQSPDLVTNEARDAACQDLPEAIGFIRTSTQKMDRLINAILRLSREGRRQITPEPLNMNALLDGVVANLRHRIDELGTEVVIAPALPAIVSDRLAMEQILSNIIENAIKYLTPGRPGRIEVRALSEAGRATFTIADNGRGVDPKDHERIFDLFRRSGQQDQPGEGIGLAHTRALAYRLGGTISVESELGKGANFRINLPILYAGEQGTTS